MAHDDQDDRFSLRAAWRAGQEGVLGLWVGDLLASPGSDNAVLAAALAQEERFWLGPVRIPLSQLTPMAGPDEDRVVCPIDEDEWEQDVGAMAESLEQGWEPPPLLVSYHDGGLFLEDGNHRWETLRRAGETHAWAVVWCDTVEERERFLIRFAPT